MEIQIALDMVSIGEGIKIVSEIEEYIDIIEIGTPMIYRYGLMAVTEMKKAFPNLKILFDGKIADAGAEEANMAFEAGADIVTLLAIAEDATIKNAVKEARKRNKKIFADLLCVSDISKRAKELMEMDVDYIGIHIAVDIQDEGRTFDNEFIALENIVPPEKIAVAGGINPDLVLKIAKYKPGIVIAGSSITGSQNRTSTVMRIRENLVEQAYE